MEKAIEIRDPQLNLLKELGCKSLSKKKAKREQTKAAKKKTEDSHYSFKRISKGDALHISYVVAQILGTAAV